MAEPASVLYIAAEGASGAADRIDAWRQWTGEEIGDLLAYPEPLQLGDPDQVRELEEVAGERQTSLIVYDTRARSTVGLEENSATDQGIAIEAAERIRRASGGTALVVHHSGLAGGHGRGSTAWDGAVWSDLRVTADEMRVKIHVEKHKDAPSGADHHYELRTVQLRKSTLDDPGSTLVASTSSPVSALDYDVLERRSTREMITVFRTAAGQDGLTAAQAAAFADERGLSRSSSFVAVKALVTGGVLRNVGSEKRPRYVLTGEQGAI